MPLPDYSLTKIYKIVSNQTDDIYIGSTCQKYLSKRMGTHKQDYKNYVEGNKRYVSSCEILKYDDAKIVLIQAYPECKNKEEQIKYEQDHIDKMNCINKNRAYVSKEQVREYMKEYNKEYYKNNVEKINNYRNEKIKCECGRMVTKIHMSNHRKRPIHLNNLLKTTNCFS